MVVGGVDGASTSHVDAGVECADRPPTLKLQVGLLLVVI